MANRGDLLKKVRQSLPVVQKLVYMNTGSVGPLSQFSIQAVQETQQAELEYGRIGGKAMQHRKKVVAAVRKSVAGLINADPEEIALTRSTTEGINLVITGFKWQPGDEVITTDVEHAAILLPLFVLRQRQGVVIRTAPVGGNCIADIKAQINPRTRLIAVSHVSYSTGERLPVGEIAEAASRHGIPVLVDGAQSAGAIPVDVQLLGVDYYSLPGQKWLCGPQGVGALYIRKERLDSLAPALISLSAVADFDPRGDFRWHANAHRFESGLANLPTLAGQEASIDWLTNDVGLGWVFDRTRELGERIRRELAAVPGVTVVAPAQVAGLTTFRLAGADPQQLVEYLAAQGIIIRAIKELNSVRASVGFFNTEDEVDSLVRAVAGFKA